MSPDTEPVRDDGEDIAKLIRLAGQRKPVPEERSARARAAAREAWQKEIRRRSLRRRLWTGTALAAAASLFLLVAYRIPSIGREPAAGPSGCGPIEVMAGEAQLAEQAGSTLSAPRAFVSEDSVPRGSALTTSGASRAAIHLPSGHSLRLDLSTQVRLLDAETLRLDRGALYLSSPSESLAARPLIVETALGRIREIGTQFEVRLEGESVRLRVREGAVVLSRGAAEQELAGGRELTVEARGTATSREIPAYGPEWAWMAGIAPMPDLEGETARGFLHWVAREQGWSLTFTEPGLEDASGAITVSGELEGMTIQQAMDAVLPSCGLAYTIEDGVLEVSTAP